MERLSPWISDITVQNPSLHPRFGHSFTIINEDDDNPKAILFGGILFAYI